MEEKKEEGKKPDTKNTGQQKASTKAKNTFNGKNYERLYPFVKMGKKRRLKGRLLLPGNL